MPELPDVALYIASLEQRVLGKTLASIRLKSPFLLRTAEPPLAAAPNRQVRALSRLGKRIVFELGPGADDPPGELFLVLHLMIAGRLHWDERGTPLRSRIDLAAFDFENGTLRLTEAGTRRRASLHLALGREALRAHDRGGLEVLEATSAAFRARLSSENHTLKRALCDPRLFSGIGNAYSDEILHRARLSPLQLTKKLDDEEIERLFDATRTVLVEWIERLRAQTGERFPEKVTAFRPEMAVHGRFRQPCPVCGAPVQRIVHADNETNYCARCQTGGRLLADRALSRLLKDDWPRSLEELME